MLVTSGVQERGLCAILETRFGGRLDGVRASRATEGIDLAYHTKSAKLRPSKDVTQVRQTLAKCSFSGWIIRKAVQAARRDGPPFRLLATGTLLAHSHYF